MPSDKHNSRKARARDLDFFTRARDLISSLINVASSWDVPFHQPQELQCLYHGATFVPLWSPIFSSQPCKVMIWGRHVLASIPDMKIAEALLILCLAYAILFPCYCEHHKLWFVMHSLSYVCIQYIYNQPYRKGMYWKFLHLHLLARYAHAHDWHLIMMYNIAPWLDQPQYLQLPCRVVFF